MTNEKKITVGAASQDAAAKNDFGTNAMEVAKTMLSDYDKNLMEAVERGRKAYGTDTFYIVVIGKRERLMDNVLRNFFLVRQSCPTPQNEQTVYRYDGPEEKLEFIWIVPDDETCRTYIMNKHLVDPSEYELLQYIIDFSEGTLYKLALTLNGELFK